MWEADKVLEGEDQEPKSEEELECEAIQEDLERENILPRLATVKQIAFGKSRGIDFTGVDTRIAYLMIKSIDIRERKEQEARFEVARRQGKIRVLTNRRIRVGTVVSYLDHGEFVVRKIDMTRGVVYLKGKRGAFNPWNLKPLTTGVSKRPKNKKG